MYFLIFDWYCIRKYVHNIYIYMYENKISIYMFGSYPDFTNNHFVFQNTSALLSGYWDNVHSERGVFGEVRLCYSFGSACVCVCVCVCKPSGNINDGDCLDIHKIFPEHMSFTFGRFPQHSFRWFIF